MGGPLMGVFRAFALLGQCHSCIPLVPILWRILVIFAKVPVGGSESSSLMKSLALALYKSKLLMKSSAGWR
ncbi:hypothetical protein L6452_17954 [Arctium lappa]|uniref:Uncharacterized protein n=1 Tax=Arctium lappa TaxID=4217 RepID=A0ACB9C512_ARCLA|nr:hypothetical protein L6452_17954 [Arctium lappa]